MRKQSHFIAPHLATELSHLPNQAGLQSLIKGDVLGTCFSDNPDQYIIIKSTDAYCFFAGDLLDFELEHCVQFLRTFPTINLVCDARHHSRFIKHGMTISPRIDLLYTQSHIDITPHASIKAYPILSGTLGRKSPWWDFIVGLYGSEEIFFKNGFGFALCDAENNVLSASYAACVGGGYAEIGIATAQGHEGKGLATLASKYCIQKCLEMGLIPEWSCEIDNRASWHIAVNIGFTVRCYYAALTL